MKTKIIMLSVAIAAAAASLINVGCATSNSEGQSSQAVIDYGARIALTGAVYAIVENNPSYTMAFRQASTTLTRLSWAQDRVTLDEVKEALRIDFSNNEDITEDQANKAITTLAGGLALYETYLRSNPDGAYTGQNSLLSALASGISNALLAGAIFDDNGATLTPFTQK